MVHGGHGQSLRGFQVVKFWTVHGGQDVFVNGQFGIENRTQYTVVLHQTKQRTATGEFQNFLKFHPVTFHGNQPQPFPLMANGQLQMGVHRPQRPIIESKKAIGPEDTKGVLFAALHGFTHGSKASSLQIMLALKRVMDRLAGSINGHAVDGEIPSAQIFEQRMAPFDVFRASPVSIHGFGPKGGDFVECAVALERHGAEGRPSVDRLAFKKGQRFFRRASRRQIDVRCPSSLKQGVSNTPADDPNAVTVVSKPIENAGEVQREAVQPLGHMVWNWMPVHIGLEAWSKRCFPLHGPASYWMAGRDVKKHYGTMEPRRGMDWTEEDIVLVPLEWLKPHEEVKERNRDKLLEMTKRWGGYTKPLIVDKHTGAILDGHHRHSVGQLLGLKRVPAICIDYLRDDDVQVDVWPGCGLDTISKQEVIDMSLSEGVFPPKTSRHTIADHTPPIFIPLERLLVLPSLNGPDAT